MANLFYQHIHKDIHVSNNSWGISVYYFPDDVPERSYYQDVRPETVSAIIAAQANGTLFIFAAGNEGRNIYNDEGYKAVSPGLPAFLPYFENELKAAWLAVVAVDANLTETPYKQLQLSA